MLAEFLKLMMDKVTPQRFQLLQGEDPDRIFFSGPVVQAPLPRAPKLAATREVARLSALVEYLEENRDDLDLGKHLVHVVSPSRVEVLGPLDALHRTREAVLAAVYPVDGAAALQQWTDLDTGRIAIMSQFYQTDARDNLLAALRKVTREKVETREDSTGLSQTVTVSDGTATRGLATIENPVMLAPFCSFPEVGLIERPFVFRIDSDGLIRLFPADGRAWETEAVDAIKRALDQSLSEAEVAVPVIG